MNSESKTGTLHIVATPIGNLGDISLRAQNALASADLVACEDTRHTRKLMSHLKISSPLTSFHRDNEQQKSAELVGQLLAGANVALVSDAGTPGLSDPGAALVQAARAAGIAIIPVPGPSALATALSVAGLNDSDFYFGGFPAAKKSERRKQLTALRALPCPLIFYEAPHRIHATLQDCLELLGDRPAQLFRELTKLHEEHLAGSTSELLRRTSGNVLGELVLIVSGRTEKKQEIRPEDLDALILWHRDKEQSTLKDAVRIIAENLELSKSQVYQRALDLWRT